MRLIQIRVLACAVAVASALVVTRPAVACVTPPAPVRDIDLPRFYADTEGSVVDAKLAAAHKAAVEPLDSFLRHVTQEADKALKRSKSEAQAQVATCAVRWLEAWAKGDAWLGRMGSKQAEYQRKWDLAGAALAYLKVRSFATPRQRAVIEPWLVRFADTARAFFDSPDRKRNNHWYWMGLAVGSVALAADSPRHWEMARGIMTDAAADIGADGTLPHELERKSRALHYHAFAVMPLVVLAELAHSKGEDWYRLGHGALHRLARVTLDGLADPRLFERIAGIAQETPVRPGAGWTQVYAARFPDRLPRPIAGAPDGHRWLGGNVTVLSEVLAKQR